MPRVRTSSEDVETFVAKLRLAFWGEGYSPTEVTTVLAWLLCESLGMEQAEMLALFIPAAYTGLDTGLFPIRRVRELDQAVRECLRDQLQLPDGFVEVSDEPTLDRIAALAAAAVTSFIRPDGRVENEQRQTIRAF